MIKRPIEKIPNRLWKVFALFIVMLIVGPELLAGVELIALVNLIGADVFVITTFASFSAFALKPTFKKFIEFEKNSNFYIPSIEMITKNPNCLFFLIPMRTLTYSALLFICFVFVIKTIPYWIKLI